MRKRAGLFAEWIASTKKTLTEIAGDLGCSVQAVSNIRGGHCKPGRELANKIAEASGGLVPATAWDRPRKKRATA